MTIISHRHHFYNHCPQKISALCLQLCISKSFPRIQLFPLCDFLAFGVIAQFRRIWSHTRLNERGIQTQINKHLGAALSLRIREITSYESSKLFECLPASDICLQGCHVTRKWQPMFPNVLAVLLVQMFLQCKQTSY